MPRILALSSLPAPGFGRRQLFGLAILVIFSAASSRAALLYWVQSSVEARFGTSVALPDTGQQQTNSVTAGPVGFNVNDANGTHNSNIAATAALGHLFGNANAFDQFLQSPVGPDATTFTVQWADTITPLSATLPVNTSVNVLATLALSDTLTSLAATCCSNVNASGLGLVASDQSVGGNNISHTVIQTKILLMTIGTPMQIGGNLFFDAGSSAGASPGTPGGSTVKADVRYFLDPLTPTVSLSSASGNSYASVATPEPGTAMLLPAGLLSMLLWRAARRYPKEKPQR